MQGNMMVETILFVGLLLFLLVYFLFLYRSWRKYSLSYLKKMEDDKAQIIQLEKMASLGTLSAGIAHEINNPLTFLITNLDLITGYVGKMHELSDVDTRKSR